MPCAFRDTLKAAVLAEYRNGDKVQVIATRHRISRGCVDTWRKEAGLQRRKGWRVTRTSGRNAGNLSKCDERAAECLALCEAYLEANPGPAIVWRRCEHCDGRERPDQPHQHAA